MKCLNYETDNEMCRYFAATQGTDDVLPSGCDADTGNCYPFEHCGYDWDLMDENMICDMKDLEIRNDG